MPDKYKIFLILITILLLSAPFISLAWQVKITISTPDPNSDTGLATNNLYFGADPTATNNYDNLLDVIALLIGPVRAYFWHPEYPSHLQKLWRDFRAEILPQTWEILVDVPTINIPISFNWSGNLPANTIFNLIDASNNEIILMNSTTSYNYTQTISQKRFLIQAISGILDTIPPASPTNLRVW